MMYMDSESTDGEKRKREKTKEDNEEERNAFTENKKISRTPVKWKQMNEDKLDRVLDMLQQLTLNVNQIKLELIKNKNELKPVTKATTGIKSNKQWAFNIPYAYVQNPKKPKGVSQGLNFDTKTIVILIEPNTKSLTDQQKHK
ncbi:hypothetical protein FQA39_LY09199 [Lamprigera yunnana]|nr:hypothetical protein FQA39_LY09199 [Lamprigera yunnana]